MARFSDRGPRVLACLLVGIVSACGDLQGSRATGAADTLSLSERGKIPGTIAFTSERDGNPEVYLIRPTGEGERRLTNRTTAEFPIAAAPDGSAVMVVSTTDESTGYSEQLLLHPLGGEAPTPLTPRTGRARNASWSPDGRWIVFESDLNSFSDLYRIDPDGSGLRRLTDDPQGNFEPVISPDGKQIVLSSSRDMNAEMYRIRSDGGSPERLTWSMRDEWGARWSPDGRSVAFLSDKTQKDEIHLVEPNGAGERRLNATRAHPEARSTDLLEGEIAWSPDGRKIAYSTRDRQGRSRIWVADLRKEKHALLSDGSGNDEKPVWSPGGRYIAFVSTRDGDRELYLMRADGSAPTRLTRTPGADGLPLWIPPPTGAGARRAD